MEFVVNDKMVNLVENPGFYMVKPKPGVTGVLGDVIPQSNIGFAGKS